VCSTPGEHIVGLSDLHDLFTSRSSDPETVMKRINAETETETDDVVANARSGERRAWITLVERYLPLIRAIARRYQLSDTDVEDVGQTVYLRLVEHLDRIREPRALPGWITTTARNESLRLVGSQRKINLVDPLDHAKFDRSTDGHVEIDADLLRAEQVEALRNGLSELSPIQRDLLLLLTDDEERKYHEIGDMLTMPIGSIGPTRARGLARLRETPAVQSYFAAPQDNPLPRSA
jgi:RNA polymerase sigma factor (sigma-70 family)